MSEDRATSADHGDELEEIFVSITGKTSVTLPQNQGPGRGVIDAASAESPPDAERPDNALAGSTPGNDVEGDPG